MRLDFKLCRYLFYNGLYILINHLTSHAVPDIPYKKSCLYNRSNAHNLFIYICITKKFISKTTLDGSKMLGNKASQKHAMCLY